MRRVIKISKDSKVSFIYSDALQSLLKEASAVSISRASYVEPVETPDGPRWTVDMSPVGGPRLSNLHVLHSDALAEEVAWLNAHRIPIPHG